MFAVAAIAKVDAWSAWRDLAAQIAPRESVRVIAVGVPAAEATLAAVALTVPLLGLGAAAVVLALFAVSVAALIPRLGGTACSCFGAASSSTLGWTLVARNVVLSVVAALGAAAAVRSSSDGLTIAGIVCVALVGLIAVVAGEGVRFVRASYPALRGTR